MELEPKRRNMTAFVTVGSTKFDHFVEAVLSEPVITTLRLKGFSKLIVQYGKSNINLQASIRTGNTSILDQGGLRIETLDFRPTLQEEYGQADLVISHAGSGTILEVLRLGKSLIVVPNPTLLDNHQEELAFSLGDLGYLKAVNLQDLLGAIENLELGDAVPFPPFDGSRFLRVLDEEMSFV